MELLVEINSELRGQANSVLNPPLHNTMGPKRSATESSVAGSTSDTYLGQSSLDKVAWVWNGSRWLADLGHGRGNEVGDDELYINSLWLELGGERSGPLLEEGLGSGVSSEKRSWQETAERAHGEDKSALALGHSRCDDTGNLEGANAVNGDDIAHLLLWREGEWDRVAVGLSDVVDQDSDVLVLDDGGETGVVGRVVLGEIHSENLGLDQWGLGLDLSGEGDELGFGAGHEDEVEALVGELESVFLAHSVRGAGDDGPGALWSILAELKTSQYNALYHRDSIAV